MPKLITTPFAINGQKNEITVNTPESDNSATYDVGFPPVTSLPIASGGKPPKGADFNGLFYDITDNISYLTLGNGYVFNTGLSYPLNARINRTDGVRVRSTVANNTTNPNTSMVGWEVDSLSPSQNLLELTDKATARTNLGVYSKAETDNIVGTPNATETVAGKAKIATTAIAQEGEDDTAFITPLKLAETVFGIGQTTKVGSYVANTIYTNTTPKLIFISITGTPNQESASTSIHINVNGVLFSAGGSFGRDSNAPLGCIAPIPAGSEWSYSSIRVANISVMELS